MAPAPDASGDLVRGWPWRYCARAVVLSHLAAYGWEKGDIAGLFESKEQTRLLIEKKLERELPGSAMYPVKSTHER